MENAEPPRVNGSVERSSDPQRHRSEGRVERAEPTRANGSSERSNDPLQDRATPEVDPEEAAIEDSPSGVNDSAERLRQPEDHTLLATSGLLSAVPTSTGVDTEALPTTDLEQAAWCDTAVRTEYVLPVTSPVSLLTQTSFTTHSVLYTKKVTKERDDARSEIVESQQSARNLFNEQKRLD